MAEVTSSAEGLPLPRMVRLRNRFLGADGVERKSVVDLRKQDRAVLAEAESTIEAGYWLMTRLRESGNTADAAIVERLGRLLGAATRKIQPNDLEVERVRD